MSIVNNENDLPTGLQHNSRSLKCGLRQHPYKDSSGGKRVEKRRGLKPHLTTTSNSANAAASMRRPVLGDVTNKINIKKSTTMGTSMQHKPTKYFKRPQMSHSMTGATKKLVPTTPVVNTLGSLDLGDRPSPMAIATSLEEEKPLKPIVEEDHSASKEEEERVHDIDSEDRGDATACWQYAEDMTTYHLLTEKKRMSSPTYMSRQSDVNSKMRAILIDWLVDVHFKYDLHPQTLHIAVHLIDRHLEQALSLPRQKLQLVGVTALFIASKYEEIYPPEAGDFVKITDNAYTKEELFAMEVDVLMNVGYRVTFPTAYQFVKRFIKASRTCDDRVEHFAHYVIDRALQEYKLIKYAPSRIASAAVHIARTQMNDVPAWNSTLEHHTSYTESRLQNCVEDLKEMLWNAQNGVGKATKLTAVRRKYEKERFMGVASHPLVFENGQ